MAYIILRYQSILQCVFTLNNNNLIYYVTTLQGWQSLLPCVRRQLTTHVFPPHMWPQRHGYKAVHTLEISGTIYELVNILQNVATLTSSAVAIRKASFTQKTRNFPHTFYLCVLYANDKKVVSVSLYSFADWPFQGKYTLSSVTLDRFF
jgi:hypothetical protein